ncbi:MAG TPA: deoxyguanosinetriphosphate triphosphohydrolase [bacterium]|jgi:dGTPase|nr:deoxyguanosinetriphosphate triphosphohydrolase [bacterium]
MRTREELERLEEAEQASFSQLSKSSKGRQYPEPEHPYRTAFQRDRDRVIHSSAFRRLQYKTQVFVNHEGDYYRTRITHTMEVAQIARSIARSLGLNQDLTEAIALAHDLGHTPFGHSGEKVLNEIMKNDGGFEHNAQSYRIVTHLEDRYPDFRGLNLTYEVLEGVDKHRTRYDRPGGAGEQYTLEAQIVDLADEIAYTSHDIDDGLTSGLLDFEGLNEVPLWKRNMEKVKSCHPQLSKDKIKYQSVRFLIDEQVTDLLDETVKRIAKFGARSVEDVRKCPEELASFSNDFRQQFLEMKRYLFQNMYRHHRVTRMEGKSAKVIQELFKLYEGDPTILPTNTREKIKNKAEPVKRIICDYIAGMTDRYAIEEFEKLTEPSIRV